MSPEALALLCSLLSSALTALCIQWDRISVEEDAYSRGFEDARSSLSNQIPVNRKVSK